MTKSGSWSVVALAAALALTADRAAAVDWSDNAFRYSYGGAFTEPGIGSSGESVPIKKNIFSFTHVDGYKLGGNFLNVDMLFSSIKDPVNNDGNLGATEVYAIYRHSFSLNKISGRPLFAMGPFADLLLQAGADANTKNTAFAPSKIMPVLGPVVALRVPGFWNVGVLLNKEWNSNGFATAGGMVSHGGTVVFDLTTMFTTAWAIPIGSWPFSFEGFGLVNLPKGKDGFGLETKTEVLFHPKLLWDVGTLWKGKGYQVGVGYEYWLNKFGEDHNAVVGALQSTFLAEAAIHL